MFDIGWTELLVIGVVALIVIGPKDLPGMFRTLGRFTAKARGMAREFTRAMEEAADDSGVKDIAGDLKNMTSSKNLGLDKVQAAADRFEKWDPMKKSTATKGPATEALSKERAEVAKKINEAAAKRATDRLEAQAKSEAAAAAPAPDAKVTKKAAAPKKAAAKAAPKAAAAKTAPKTAKAKAPAAKKTAAPRKPAAKAAVKDAK